MGLKRALAILFLAAFVPFARSLLFGAVILDDDIFLQSLPAWEWLSRSLHSGESILWCPEMMGGFPIAFTQYPFLYPPDLLLAWILPPVHAYSWSMVLHIFAAGLLTYLYCRVVGLGASTSLLAALAYQLSTEVVAGSSGFAAHSAFALPGMLLGIELISRRGWRYGPVLSLVVAAALLGGHAQLVLFSLEAALLYGLFRMVTRMGRTQGAMHLALICGFAVLLGVAIAAVRLLPTWEVVGFSTRSMGLPEAAAGLGALTIQGLVAGSFMPLTRLETLPWGAPGYLGPAAVVLTLLGLRFLASQPLGRFFLGLGALSALLSLGDATPLHLLTRLPLLSLFREPSRLSLITTFCLAALSAMSLDGFCRRAKGDERWLGVGTTGGLVIAVLVAFGLLCVAALFQFGVGPAAETLRDWVQQRSLDLLNPMRPRMALALLGLPLTLGWLALAARGSLSQPRLEALLLITVASILVPLVAILNPTVSPEVIAQTPEVVRYLNGDTGQYRVFSHRPGMRLYNHVHYYGPGPEARATDDLRYRFHAAMLAPVLNLRWGIPSADGYEQLHSRFQEELLRYIDSERTSPWIDMPGKWAHLTMEQRLRVLRMMGVRYILSGTDLSSETKSLSLVYQTEVAPGPASRAAPAVFLLESRDPLPRFHLVTSAQVFADDTEALDAVALGQVDPGETVLLVEVVRGQEGDGSPVSDRPSPGSVELLSSHNTEVILRITNDRPVYLVSSDVHWQGWRALLDEQETPILRANVGGRAIWIPESGSHIVRFDYRPRSLEMGGIASVVAGGIWLGWFGLALVQTQSRHKKG